MKLFSIYVITNVINDKSYIGFTSKNISERIKEHFRLAKNGQGWKLHNAIRKYGQENFTWQTIYQSKDKAFTRDVIEPQLIRELNTIKEGYNISKGGDGVRLEKQSQDHISKRVKSTNITKSINKKPVWNKGLTSKSDCRLKQTEETCEKKSKYMKQNNPFKNKHHSDKTKELLRSMKLNKPNGNKNYIGISDGVDQKFVSKTSDIPAGWYVAGIPKSDSMKQKLKGNSNAKTTPVTINGILYCSKADAVRALNLPNAYHLEKLYHER